MTGDTIFAPATARGKAGVAVVRVSGPKAFDAVDRLCGQRPRLREARVRHLRSHDGELIDEALVLMFPKGSSFTRENIVEFQVHGSPAVVSFLLRELASIEGFRHAEAGEFTRRALENDRLDLTQIEGLGDLIEAETEAQRRQAQRVMSGRLSALVESWRADLIRAMALLEATIDFVDEDVPVDVMPEVRALLTTATRDMQREATGVHAAERVRAGFRVAIVGPPNAGKSTLLNYLAGRDVAITSEVAGTTRDVIEVQMDIRGIPVTLLDTAGLREATDQVEQIGVRRAREVAQDADIRLHLLSPQEKPLARLDDDDFYLMGKDDNGTLGGVSGYSGAGVDRLLDHIADRLSMKVGTVGAAIKERHRTALTAAVTSVHEALGVLDTSSDTPEIAVEALRQAVVCIETLVGRVDVEHILDDIFSRFCIGK